MGPSSSSLSQYRQQIGHFENRDPSSRVEARARERAVARANRNDQGNYNGRSVTAAKAMLGVIIASSIAAGVASAAASSSCSSGVSSSSCLTVSSTSSNKFRFGSVRVNSTCPREERIIFARECIKKGGGLQRSFDVKPGEDRVLNDVKGRCYRGNRWRLETVNKEKSVMCEIASAPRYNQYSQLASDWVRDSKTSCPQKKVDAQRLDEMKEVIKKCVGLDNSDKSELDIKDKKQCYSALTDSGIFMGWKGRGEYSSILENAADEFNPNQCNGHVNLMSSRGALGQVYSQLSDENTEVPTETPETANELICELSKGPDSDQNVIKAKKVIENSGITCPETDILAMEVKIRMQDNLVKCVGYDGVSKDAITEEERKDCYMALKEVSSFMESRNNDLDKIRANLLTMAAECFYPRINGSHVNLNGFKGAMKYSYDVLCDLVNVDETPGMQAIGLTKAADEMLCGISFGPDSDPQVKLAQEWVNGSGMNCTSMVETGDRSVLEQLRKDLVECYRYDGKSRKEIPKEAKEKCQQTLTDAARLISQGVENGQVYAQLLRETINDFDPEQCAGYINLNSVKSSFSKVNDMISAKLGSNG